MATERATVRGIAAADALVAAIDKAGYEARIVAALARPDDDDTAARKDAERLAIKRDLMLASLLALPVFVLEMGSHLVPAMHEWVTDTVGKGPSWYLRFVLTTIILLITRRDGRFWCSARGLRVAW